MQSFSSGNYSIKTDGDYTQMLLTDCQARELKYQNLAQNRYRYYAAKLQKKKFSLLEIGCGNAGLATGFQQCGVDYYGIDIDQRTIAKANESGIEQVRCLDFFSLPKAERFDVICCSQVLEHIIEPRLFVDKVKSHLLPAGIFHADVPNDCALAGYLYFIGKNLNQRYHGILLPYHQFAYQKKTFRVLLESFFNNSAVFTASPTHSTWGKAMISSISMRTYYLISQLMGMKSLLVGIAQKI
jgi:2-polyprenyl-3-methyl-5-hydroxy-6-metoxy-1,4-benzoquinol methylase